MKKHVYLLPGREETFADNLAKSIESLGLTLCGREIVRDFARLRFAEQLALIKSDLQTAFWKPDAKIVARSYGAYLLLNTLAEMNPFPGRILLLSPVLGVAVANDGFYVSRPRVPNDSLSWLKAETFPVRVIWRFTPVRRIRGANRYWRNALRRWFGIPSSPSWREQVTSFVKIAFNEYCESFFAMSWIRRRSNER